MIKSTLVLLSALMLASCGDDASACTPGASAACVGPGGCSGGQVCNAEGTGFGECVCGAGGDSGTDAGDAQRDAGFVPDGASESDARTDDAGPWGPLLAFPTAEGAGRNTTGGRGGVVIHVTNLNDSGAGSLREALSASGPRTVVFDVSGTIVTESRMEVTNGDLTIAGQTAPEGGVSVVGHGLIIDDASNVVVRYLRVRGDKAKMPYGLGDCLALWYAHDIIIDHVSNAYGGDENYDLGNGGEEVTNITVQRSVVGEGKTGMLFGAEEPSSHGQLSILRNLFLHVHHRTPNVSSDYRAEIVNNIIYNWQVRLSTNTRSAQANYIGNYYKPGVMTWTPSPHWQNGNILPAGGSQRVYNEGNYWDGHPDFTADNWLGWAAANSTNYVLEDQSALRTTYASDTRILVDNPVVAIPATDAFDDVLDDVGANRTLDGMGQQVTYMDSVDDVYITDVRNGTYVNQTNGNYQWYETADYDFGNPPQNTRPEGYDTDRDGMPDAWESANGLDPSDGADGAEDHDDDGYTNLEDYLNQVDR